MEWERTGLVAVVTLALCALRQTCSGARILDVGRGKAG